MINKEERIYISHYTKDVCSDCLHDHCYEGLCNCDFEYKNGMTRQEAIEVMAKAIFSKSGFPKDCIWEKINEETKTAFRLYAREALNELSKWFG